MSGRNGWLPGKPNGAAGASPKLLMVGEVLAGKVDLGPATTSMLLPVLLPSRCCHEARPALCFCCESVGYTHGRHPAESLRCVECATWLAETVRERLRRPG